MKLTMPNVVALIFIVVSLASLSFILVASSNYNNYYWQARSAVLDPSSNNTIIRSMVASKDPSTGLITITARVSTGNPTGYQGLVLDQFALTLFCFHTGNINQSLFTPSANNLQSNDSPHESLSPYSTVSKDLVFNLNATQSSQLQSFNQTYQGNIEAHVITQVSITSFLDSVFGPMMITKDQSLAILWL